MSDLQFHGPVVTYVTDENLDAEEQQRVLRAFVACAGDHALRVAFRLPAWSDSDFLSLLKWYRYEIRLSEVASLMEPPLVHDRPEACAAFPGSRLWLPWRNRDLVRPDDVGRLAISVHSVEEAHEAVSVGASELIFGHVFTSESHPGEQGRGISALLAVKEAAQAYENPPRVIAIGGIDEHTIPEIGANRHCHVATMRTISRSTDIAHTLERIRSRWIAARINADLDAKQRSPFGNPSSIFF